MDANQIQNLFASNVRQLLVERTVLPAGLHQFRRAQAIDPWCPHFLRGDFRRCFQDHVEPADGLLHADDHSSCTAVHLLLEVHHRGHQDQRYEGLIFLPSRIGFQYKTKELK